MWKNNNNYLININISEDKIMATLTDGESDIADFSLATPKDNFKKFITMLRALVGSLESIAEEKGIEITKLIFHISSAFELVKAGMVKCKSIPVLNNINLEDYLVEYKGKVSYI
ncbi:MAG: hypothetical protein NT091_03485 [Candidatus Falkowbacteria bacterium]|nr:hypothetical protein [Candidatus Falkowbacteria bacterium]